jgi:glycosyltransferase involved in cell wall biosynthesis
MPHDNPTISIIMPLYNSGAYLTEAIESIVAQTYTEWELIIVNDSSTDNGPAIAQEWAEKDLRITVITNTNPKGLAGAINSGLAAARGAYIARADGDDINVPDRFAIQLKFLKEHPEIDIVGGWYETFGEGLPRIVRKHPTRPVTIAWKFLTNTYFCHPTTMYRRSVLADVPQYPYTGSEDFGFFSQAIHTHQGANIPRVLLHYRQHQTNYSHTEKPAIAKSIQDIYAQNFLWYRGNMEHVDIFFQFHTTYDLPLRHLWNIISISISIARKIITTYQASLLEKIHLYSAIKIHIILALGMHYARKLKKLC